MTVLGKAEINLHCKAHLATSGDGATVLGSAEQDGAVTVLGASHVIRVGCEDGVAAAQE